MKEPVLRSRLNTESLWVLNNKITLQNNIKLILLGDSHLNTTGWNNVANEYNLDANGKRYMKILDHIIENHNDALFIIHGGDAIGDGFSENNTYEKHQNMKAYVYSSKSKLFPHNLPIFTTLGNMELISKENELTPKLFQQYIGNLRNDIYIPGTRIHFLSIPTLFLRINGQPTFDQLDLQKLQLKINQNRTTYYIIDFHAPLKVGKLKMAQNLKDTLKADDTAKFLNRMDQNVIAVFNHHIHIGYETLIDCNKVFKIPYVLTGNAGNTDSELWPNYYVIRINNQDESNPVISEIRPIVVPNI